MSGDASEPSSDEGGGRLDEQRLERGIEQLRALGYLQSPADSYVARSVARRGTRTRTALAAGVWIGGGSGAGLGLLITLGALVAEPGLATRPATLAWLWFEITAVLAVLAGIGFFGLAAFLLGRTGAGPLGIARYETWASVVPSLVTAVYLADRLGRTTLVALEPDSWWLGALSVAVGVGLLGAVAARSLVAALALARLQSRGTVRTQALRWWERALPWASASVLAAILLVLGPYRGLQGLPALDDLEVQIHGTAQKTFVLAIDGVVDPIDFASGKPIGKLGATRRDLHPAAFWNELATGFAAEEHGIRSASASGLKGWESGTGRLRDDPVLDLLLRHLLPGVGLGRTIAADRRELMRPPVWEIVARAGGRARTVNWWATYPAVQRSGLDVVSDREFLRLFDGQPLDSAVTWPETWRIEDPNGWLATLRATRDSVSAFVGGRRWIESHAGEATAELLAVWDLATGADLHHLWRATASLDTPVAPTLIAVYLNGLDIVERALERSGVADPAELRDLQRQYVLEVLADHAPPADYEIITWMRATASGHASVEGWATPSKAEVTDTRAWAASLLVSQGIAPARDMKPQASLPPGARDWERPKTYGRAGAKSAVVDRSGHDLERLRSLGYIGQ